MNDADLQRIVFDDFELILEISSKEVLGRREIFSALLSLVGVLDFLRRRRQGVDAGAAGVADRVDDSHVPAALKVFRATIGSVRA